jgi:predicted CoA-binding protein
MRETIDTFFSADAYAVIGVSQKRHKFGNQVFREMKQRGFTVYPVHPTHSEVEGEHCYASVSDLPNSVQSVVIVLQPADTEIVVAQCKWKGIQNIWLQPGAESDGIIAYAREYNLNLVHDQCVLMFLEPVKSLHAVHRWVNRVVGKYPAKKPPP